MTPKCTDDEFIKVFRQLQSMKLVAAYFGMARESAQRRLLTFRNGKLMWPEIICKWDDDHVEFRGELVAA